MVSREVARRRSGVEEGEGLSKWERIVLEEELRAGWRVWNEAQQQQEEEEEEDRRVRRAGEHG